CTEYSVMRSTLYWSHALRDRLFHHVLRLGKVDAGPPVHLHDYVNVGTAVANVDHVVCRNAAMSFELLQPRNFSITGRGPHQALDLTRGFVLELSAKDMILRHDPLQRRLDHLQRCRREHVKIKVESVNPLVEYLVNLLDVVLEANALAHLEQVVAPDARTELRIVQKKISQLGALLNQVQFRHALDFALEFV